MVAHVGAGDLAEAHVGDGLRVDGSVQVTKTSLTRKPVKVGGDDTDHFIHILPTLKVSLMHGGEVGSGLGSDLSSSLLLVDGDDRVVADNKGKDEGSGEDDGDKEGGVRHDRLLDNVPTTCRTW